MSSYARRAHPRSRGENRHWCDALEGVAGSSPLTRGKLSSMDEWNSGQGLIPAHAGKTCSASMTRSSVGAHPRSRGENASGLAWRRCPWGSSPLTRGKLFRTGQYVIHDRLIPAHAGKTFGVDIGDVGQQAHPRSRGENRYQVRMTSATLGSSPLTRGKLLSVLGGSLSPRLIPAHAGKTPLRSNRHDLLGAHPRSRGENIDGFVSGIKSAGSSPLTRGKRPTRAP